MRYETTKTTTLPPENVWARLVQVEKWPDFIETYRSVRLQNPGDLSVGSRANIVQVGLRPADWEVTELDAGRSFSWRNRQPGVLVVAWHRVDRAQSGGSRLTLGVEMTGPLGVVVGALLGRKTRRYLDIEIAAFTAS